MNKWLKLEFVLCVVFPILFCPVDYFLLNGSLIGSLYGFGLIPLFLFDWYEERKKRLVS